MADWDWKLNESVVVESVQALAVYTNTGGSIVIRQQDSMGEDDDVVIVPRQHVSALIKALKAELKKPS